MHLDMETDNVEAEVARLGALGARIKYKIKDWVAMEAPVVMPFVSYRFIPRPGLRARPPGNRIARQVSLSEKKGQILFAN